MKIRTEHIYPPISIRDHDWTTIDADTYDGPGSPIGTGATKQDAIDDLMEQLGELQRDRCLCGTSFVDGWTGEGIHHGKNRCARVFTGPMR